MRINNVEIEDTFAEAFGMKAAGIIITAVNEKWAMTAARTATGFATSIIGCGCEAGVDRIIPPEETIDGRPGAQALFFTMSTKDMKKQLMNRIGQCIMTSTTSACYNALESDNNIKTGGKLRFFGDGFQSSKLIAGRRFWRVPVMDGEFLIEESYSVIKAIGGGNFFILAKDINSALCAAENAIEEMNKAPGVIMPFPGGIVRSGSKVGSRYKGQHVSVNTAYCPSIRSMAESSLPDGVNAVLEIVIDGLDEEAIKEATRRGILKACMPGVIKISAGNYGGKLGPYHFHLREVMKTV